MAENMLNLQSRTQHNPVPFPAPGPQQLRGYVGRSKPRTFMLPMPAVRLTWRGCVGACGGAESRGGWWSVCMYGWSGGKAWCFPSAASLMCASVLGHAAAVSPGLAGAAEVEAGPAPAATASHAVQRCWKQACQLAGSEPAQRRRHSGGCGSGVRCEDGRRCNRQCDVHRNSSHRSSQRCCILLSRLELVAWLLAAVGGCCYWGLLVGVCSRGRLPHWAAALRLLLLATPSCRCTVRSDVPHGC